MNFRKDYFLIVLAAILLLVQQSSLKACGLSEDVPTTHFPGVDEYGDVRYWDKIADIDLGGGLIMPLSIGFGSDWNQSSPCLGYGWALPLLDSHIVQKNEYSFEVLQPDGYTRPFMRDAKDPTLLSGGPGWMGKVDGDHTITLWASCGWKMIYKEGKIVSMSTPKGKTLTFERDASGAVTEITEGTLVLLKVEQDYPTVKITLENQGGIQGPGGEKTIVLTQVEKPRIEIVDGTNAVAATDWSLGRVVVNGDEAQAKTFSYTPTASLQLEITIQNGADAPSRQIVWNTVTHFIVSDGEWTYKITPAGQKGYKAAIDRKNTQGGEEFWHQDDVMGQETTLSLDGTKRIETWFTSGVLAGKQRNQIILLNNKIINKNSWSYNEQGNLIRSVRDGASIDYDEMGRQVKITKNGVSLKYQYDSEGFITAITKTQ